MSVLNNNDKTFKKQEKDFYNLIENIFNQSWESIVVPFRALFMRVSSIKSQEKLMGQS